MNARIIIVLLLFLMQFSHAQEITTSATCGKCGRAVSSASRVGDRCPYCHVVWNDETSASVDSQRKSQPTSQIGPEEVEPIAKRSPKYLLYLADSSATLYGDKKGRNRSGILLDSYNYGSDTIEGEYIRVTDKSTGKKLGWAHYKEFKIYEKTIVHPDDPSQDKFRLMDSIDFARHGISFVEDNSDPTSGNGADFSRMTPEQAGDFITRKAKEEGTRIYWSSMLPNILIVIGGAILIFLFQQGSKPKSS